MINLLVQYLVHIHLQHIIPIIMLPAEHSL